MTHMTTDIIKLAKAQAEAEARGNVEAAKAAAKEAHRLEVLEGVVEYLEDNDVYFVGRDDRFFIYDPVSAEWNFMSANALRNMDGRIRSPEAFNVLLEAMEAQGRMRSMKTYTFNHTPPAVLNMIRRERWLQPKFETTENTPFFTTLLRALGNDTAENIQHIKEVIGWKYLHPEDHQLPALCFFGSGGTGKNVLVDCVLATVFGKNFTLSTKFKEIEAYNDLLAGKVVVLIDEAAQDKTDADTLKRMVGNQRIQIVAKYQSTYTCDNTALFFISTNNYDGALRMEKNDSNRRWSIMKVTTPLHTLLGQQLGMDPEDARIALRAEFATNIYSNPDEVACFLGECVQAAEQLLAAPAALHGADYIQLSETQQDAVDEVLREVFIEYGDFEFIATTTLYELYKRRHTQLNPSAGAMKSSTFYGRVNEFIDTQGLQHKVCRTGSAHRPNIRNPMSGTFVRRDVYYNANRYPDGPSKLTDNSEVFGTDLHLRTTGDALHTGTVVNLNEGKVGTLRM